MCPFFGFTLASLSLWDEVTVGHFRDWGEEWGRQNLPGISG
ncbi:hypothetical protein [Litoribacter ruber]|nr:hypothetical protein [Litoribacter alkaliphilus]